MTRRPNALQKALLLPVDAVWSVFDERKRRVWCRRNGHSPSLLSSTGLCSNCGRKAKP